MKWDGSVVYFVMFVGCYVDNFDMVMLFGKWVLIIGIILCNCSDEYKVNFIGEFVMVCIFVFESKELMVNIDMYYSIKDIDKFYGCLENNDI